MPNEPERLNDPSPHRGGRPGLLDLRIGHGYDLHRLEKLGPPGVRPLVVGGVRLESEVGTVAHSDGDALSHAVADALLSAAGQPDIGELFPDDDPQYAAADSAIFLREAAARVKQAGYGIAAVDGTVLLQRPRLAPLKTRIRGKLAAMLNMHIDRVNVKGKSGEGIGPVGLGQAIECHAVVLLAPLPEARP